MFPCPSIYAVRDADVVHLRKVLDNVRGNVLICMTHCISENLVDLMV